MICVSEILFDHDCSKNLSFKKIRNKYLNVLNLFINYCKFQLSN